MVAKSILSLCDVAVLKQCISRIFVKSTVTKLMGAFNKTYRAEKQIENSNIQLNTLLVLE